ncbi:MAG: DUF4058 family protein [Prosthecobacter sp.]|uniref:DUF4058 family protein n=1 Tax=Prosthecobacter sp. TaxID=1965333 RepID=UPI0038FEF1CB
MNKQNPFPGMNPFMERTWPDVHLTLIAYIRELLGSELPDDLQAKGELRIDVSGSESRHFIPDVAILSDERWKHGLPPVWSPDPGAQVLTVTEPELLEADEEKNRWVSIYSDHGELITVIEVLSPTNKTTQRDDYTFKRGDYLAAGVNVVEIDLLRQGALTVNLRGTEYEEREERRRKEEHYSICTTRPAYPRRREYYDCPLRQKLPVIRIPLRHTDPDVPLDIQALINRCYESGRYWKLDYRAPLSPPLSAEDAAWANDCLKTAGLG